MTDSAETPRERYARFIDQMIAKTLKGEISSKEQVYQTLVAQLEPGTGEILERLLGDQANALQQQVDQADDELQQAKAGRKLRALKTLQEASDRWQSQHRQRQAVAAAVAQIADLEADPLLALVQVLDPNQTTPFDPAQIQQLSQGLDAAAQGDDLGARGLMLRQLAAGLRQGVAGFEPLKTVVVSWLYESSRSVGFGEAVAVAGPWQTWAKYTTSPLARDLFAGQAQNQSAAAIATQQTTYDPSAWVELMVLLRYLQMGLITWLDQQPYSLQGGRHLVGVTYFVFASIWGELSSGLRQANRLPEALALACFRQALQSLRAFAQRENFPLYGGVFASFSGTSFRETIAYLEQPLKEAENTQEKARILTVLGYSQRWLGHYDQAIALHQTALDLATAVGDQRCQVANLNHLSRVALQQRDFEASASQAQRALITARQLGDRQGESNALANLSYCEVMLARQQEVVSFEDLERPIRNLQEGQKLAQSFEDLANQTLCALGLGIAYVILEQPGQAQPALEMGIVLAGKCGEPDLRAWGYGYLAEALYQQNQVAIAVAYGCLGLYFQEQRGLSAWKQTAALVVILQGKLGAEQFAATLQQHRPSLIQKIGVDGFDYLPQLIERYRQGG